MKKRSVRDIEVTGKTVLVRVDFNVPMRNGVITDDSRIRAALPTLNLLKDRAAKVVVCSHIGRPGGQVVEEMRLAPVRARLSRASYSYEVVLPLSSVSESRRELSSQL